MSKLDAGMDMEDFEAARIARIIKANSCTLGEARTCEITSSSACALCGWRADEAERRRRLPLFRNSKGLWQKRVGARGK